MMCVVAVCAIAILAASMRDVTFRPGEPLFSFSQLYPTIELPNLQMHDDTPLSAILMVWLASAAILVLVFLMLPPQIRRRILRQVVGFALSVLALVLALRYGVLQLPEIDAEPQNPAVPGMPTLGGGSLDQTFRPPAMPSWVTFAVTLLVVWGILLLAWLATRWWSASRSRRRAALDSIARIADHSLRELAHGRSAGDVIVETYVRMNDAVGHYRGLRRGSGSTPREFAERLESAGLPSQSVRSLTSLFEIVRYGGRASSPAEIREAVVCLESILQACGAEA